jgi:uncharacterized membrane protein YeaQ/YmgE (transglycosylase-associated protein family)
MGMVWSLVVWALIGAFVGWLTSVLWRHPQGCIMDGAVAVVAMVAGAIIYGAIVGSPQLLELTLFSLLSGVLLALVALTVVRAWRTDVEARTKPAAEAMGWEREEAPPAPEEQERRDEKQG